MTEEEIIQIWNSIPPQGDPTGKKFAAKFAQEIERKVIQVQEALYDSAYLAGVNLGFDLGTANDSEGKQRVFDSREGYLNALKNQIS